MLVQRTLYWLSLIAHNVPVLPELLGTQARIVRQFYDAGALSPDTARRYYPRSSADAAAFARLLEDFVVRQSAPGRYFLDLEALKQRSMPRAAWRQ